jgi:hypothetical protein
MHRTECCIETCLVGLGACMNVSGSGCFNSDHSRHFTSILNIVPVFALAKVCSIVDSFSAVSARSAKKKLHIDSVSRTSKIALYSCNRNVTLKMAKLPTETCR